jgi:hypothetical protein
MFWKDSRLRRANRARMANGDPHNNGFCESLIDGQQMSV